MKFSKKILASVAAVAMLASVSAGFATIGFATDSNIVSVAEVTNGFELVYSAEESTATDKVILVKIKGCSTAAALEGTIAFPDAVNPTAKLSTVLKGIDNEAWSFTPNYETKGQVSFGATLNVGSEDLSTTDGVWAKLVITTTEDKAFDVVITSQLVSDNEWNIISDDTTDNSLTKITVPKFTPDVPTVTPITEAGTKVVRHTDGLDTPAEYWVAELDPAGVAFNTIKVVATDKSGATAEDTQTIATLTGDSAISVHVAILNAANEVSKVDVTASYVE